MNTYPLTHSIPYKKIISLKFPKVSFRLFWLLTTLLIVALLVFYIFQVNLMISERYLIQDYEKKLNEISKENNNLEIKFSQLNSFGPIGELVKELGFEKVNKIDYIQLSDRVVVSK